MQVNATSNLSQQYLTALQNKHNETSTSSFKKELTKENTSEAVQTTSSTKSVDEQQPERYHEVLTYANTKGMSNDEVDKYFSERSEEERGQIKSLIYISSNFSEDDSANEAVFNEFKNANLDSSKSLISTNFFAEKSNFVNGTASLSNTIEVSHEYHMAQLAGVTNAYELGIFMNAADKARYESGNYMIMDTKFTSSEATDFLSTMTQLAKDKMDEARGTAVFDDYKEAFERYQRMNDNYNSLLAEKEESTKVDINV